MKKEYNLILNGVGGQGLLTLSRLIAFLAKEKGFDVKSSEIHGLSQRGGSVEVHLRFSKSKVFSPLILPERADFVFSLEAQEALNALYYANPQTIFLVEDYFVPTFDKTFKKDEIEKKLKRKSRNIFWTNGVKILREHGLSDTFLNVYFLGKVISLR